MLVRSAFLRAFIAVVAGILLLVPALLVAIAWTSVNLEVAAFAIVTTVLAAVWLPTRKWIAAFIASLLIAVPPYPYWLFRSESRDWYLHFFHGYHSENLPIVRFMVVFIVSLLLFAVIFWSISDRKLQDSK